VNVPETLEALHTPSANQIEVTPTSCELERLNLATHFILEDWRIESNEKVKMNEHQRFE